MALQGLRAAQFSPLAAKLRVPFFTIDWFFSLIEAL
jgi:hypothetical protein